jgi:hypothetical protein
MPSSSIRIPYSREILEKMLRISECVSRDEDEAWHSLHGLVRDEGKLEIGTKTTLLAWLERPGKVRELRVGRHAENDSIECVELSERVIECEDLSWAHEAVNDTVVSHIAQREGRKLKTVG